MLLRHSLGHEQAACAVEAAVSSVIEAGIVTADLARPGQRAQSTSGVGDAVAARI